MRSRSKFNDSAVLEILNDYVARNISISLNIDLPSSDSRKWLCDVTGLQEKQITQWFFRAKRKCSEEVIKQFVLSKLLGVVGGGSHSGLADWRRGAVPPTRSITRTSHNRTTSTLNGKLSSIRKPLPLGELQLAILEQSWVKGLLQTPMYYLPISEIAGITTERVKAWAQNRFQLGSEQLFFPEERHFDELTTRLSSMGLLQNAGLRHLLDILTESTEQKTEDRMKIKLENVVDNAVSTRVLLQSENHAEVAAVMKNDPAEVPRQVNVYQGIKQESMDTVKFLDLDPEWNPAQPKRFRKQRDTDPDWTPAQAQPKRSRRQNPSYKREFLSGANSGSGAPGKRRKRGFDPETLVLLNHAWNTQIILRSDMHEIIALLGDITVKQLKTWVQHKKHRSPEIKQAAMMRDSRSRRFSDQQRTILIKAYERNLLSGPKLAVIAELVQMSVKQVRTWCNHRKHRGPPKR